jgi:DNA-binding transcriptional LysR family regulator
VIGLVSAGLGVSIGPASIARLLAGAVEIRPLPKITTHVQLVRSADRDHPAIASFAQLVRDAYRT